MKVHSIRDLVSADLRGNLWLEDPGDPCIWRTKLMRATAEKIDALHIVGDGSCFSSDDGDMVFLRTREGKTFLLFCLGKKKNIVVPGGVNEIWESAFRNTDVRTVEMPDTVTAIKDGAFQGCKNLKSVRFSDSIRRIGDSAFQGSGLTSARLPKSLLEIGRDAFQECRDLTSVEFPSGLRTIEDFAFQGSGIRSASFPDTLRKIGIYAFSSASNLESVELRGTGAEIGYLAFARCPSLHRVQIHSGVRKLADQAFSCCENLREISLPETVECLGYGSLNGAGEIRLQKPVKGLIGAIANRERIARILLGNRTFVLPKNMEGAAADVAEEIISNSKGTPGVYSLHALASTGEDEQRTALEAFRLSGDRALGEFLKDNAEELFSREAENGEDSFTEIVGTFREAGLLPRNLMETALDLASEKGFPCATAYLLRLLEDEKSEISFSL